MTLVLVVLAGLVARDVEGKFDTATIFDIFTEGDTNKDQRLTKQEMKILYGPNSKVDFDLLFRYFDKSGDGELSLPEFAVALS